MILSVRSSLAASYSKSAEQTLDYLADQNVAIDFSRGPVKLHMVAADGLNTRDYQVSVNVYSEVTDSLYWDKVNAGKLKGVTGMTRSKTVKVGDNALTLSTAPDGSFAKIGRAHV